MTYTVSSGALNSTPTNHLQHVASTVDRRDRQTDERTDRRRSVTQTLTTRAISDSNLNLTQNNNPIP